MCGTTTQCVEVKHARQAADSRGPISQLQEFVQEEGRIFRMPANCSVLQWGYSTRMAGSSLEFRATVAFILSGVPHHVAGMWMSAKKRAQRDAAERALGVCATPRREDPLLKRIESSSFSTAKVEQERRQVETSPCSTPEVGLEPRAICWADWTDLELDLEDGLKTEVDDLKDYCFKKGSPPPVWSYKFDDVDGCQAFVEIKLNGVAHTFSGQKCPDEGMAEVDVARRVLWYLGVPGMEDTFEPDFDNARAAGQEIPEPMTTNWVRDGDSDGEDKQLAEKKTVVMRVQNRLQQLYARQLEAGTSIWRWQYVKDKKDRQWPPRCRAVVNVPLANQTFASDWVRGQREAQIDACEKVLEFVEGQFPRVGSPSGSTSS